MHGYTTTVCVRYIEKLKTSAIGDNGGGLYVHSKNEMPTFIVHYFFNKYGVKRLVQEKLVELIASLRKHSTYDKRVMYYVRVCGLHDPVPTESFTFYLQSLSTIMLDLLGVSDGVCGACSCCCHPRLTTVAVPTGTRGW